MSFFFSHHNLDEAIKKLNSIYENLSGECCIETEHEENRIVIKLNRLGHVFISGIITYSSIEPNQLRFYFETNQTLLYGFKEQLKRFKLNEPES